MEFQNTPIFYVWLSRSLQCIYLRNKERLIWNNKRNKIFLQSRLRREMWIIKILKFFSSFSADLRKQKIRKMKARCWCFLLKDENHKIFEASLGFSNSKEQERRLLMFYSPENIFISHVSPGTKPHRDVQKEKPKHMNS